MDSGALPGRAALIYGSEGWGSSPSERAHVFLGRRASHASSYSSSSSSGRILAASSAASDIRAASLRRSGSAVHLARVQVTVQVRGSGDAGMAQARGQARSTRGEPLLGVRCRGHIPERCHGQGGRQSAARGVRSARCARPSRASSPPPLPSRPGRRCSGSGRGTP